MWNTLPLDLSNCPSLNAFKRKLKTLTVLVSNTAVSPPVTAVAVLCDFLVDNVLCNFEDSDVATCYTSGNSVQFSSNKNYDGCSLAYSGYIETFQF